MADVRFVLTGYKDKIIAYSIDVGTGRLESVNIYDSQDESSVNIGDIFVAKVTNVLTNIKAAFIDYQKGSNGYSHGYLPFKANVEPILLNRAYDGRLKGGDELLVQLEKEAVRSKEPVFSYKLSAKYMSSAEEMDKVVNYGIHRTCYSRVWRSPSPYLLDLKAAAKMGYCQILSDDEKLYNELSEYIKLSLPQLEPCLKFYNDKDYSLNKLYSIETKLMGLLSKKVWLKSGAYLVIEKTEAMYVIDVNSGKNLSKKANSDYVYSVNLEAAEEIMYQIRLRNLTGMILVDFINMEYDKDKEGLLDELSYLAGKDPIKTKVIDMTALDLVEITRQKNKRGLREQVGNYQHSES
jgi:ribonuclease G